MDQDNQAKNDINELPGSGEKAQDYTNPGKATQEKFADEQTSKGQDNDAEDSFDLNSLKGIVRNDRKFEDQR